MSKFTSKKTGEIQLEMAILSSDAIFKIFSKSQFGSFTVSVEAFNQFTQRIHSSPIISSLALADTSVIGPKYAGMQSFPGSSSVCSKGTVL